MESKRQSLRRFEQIAQCITPQVRITFLSVLIFGLAAHGMGLFNKYSWHDDLYYLFGVGTTVSSGRWMLHVLVWLEDLFFMDGYFSLPLYNGLIGIFCLAVSASLIVDLLKIKNRLFCAALGCILVSFPVITGLFAYVFTFHYYMIALLCIVLSAWLICCQKKWWAWVAAILLGTGALGIYQAFYPLELSLVLLFDMMLLLDGGKADREFWKKILLQGICALAMIALYFAANQFFLIKFNQQITHSGMDDTVSLLGYLERTGLAYREFFLPARQVSRDMYPQRLYTLYQIMLLLDILMLLRTVVIQWKNDRLKAVLLILLAALFPLASNLIFVMAGTNVHGLMTYGLAAQIVLFVLLSDRAEFRLPTLRQALSVLTALVLGLTGLHYIRYANQCYLSVTLKQQEAVSWFTTLITQIKSSENYRADRPVLFLNPQQITDPTVTYLPEMNAVSLIPYEYNLKEYLNNYAWVEFMERWCGFSPVFYEGGDIQETEEAKNMPHYPDAGSIQLIQDVLVINF